MADVKKRADEKHPIIARKIKKSLNRSIEEGSFSSLMTGFGNSYITPYALALNATSSQIGWLNGVASLLPSIVQLKASRFIEKYSRKKIVVFFVILQALLFIPLIAVSWLFLNGSQGTVWWLIGIVGLMYALGAAASPAWFSWMGSLVPKDRRGKYFAKRSGIAGFFGLASMLVGAIALDKFETAGMVLVGFGLLFTLAMVGRLIAGFLFTRQYEPKIKIKKKDYFSFWQFLKNGRNTPFGRFTIYTTLMRAATNIAGPFFAVYILRDLSLSYFWFMSITVSGALFQLMFFPLVGKISDKYGNIRLLRLATGLFILSPILWLFSTNPWYLISVPHIVGGFAWAGFWIATNNYIYDSIREEKRSFGIAYHNLLNGVGLFVGAGLGAGIALLNITFMNKILFIFIVSAFARFIVYLLSEKTLREVRHVPTFSYNFLITGFGPANEIKRELHQLGNLKDKLERYL